MRFYHRMLLDQNFASNVLLTIGIICIIIYLPKLMRSLANIKKAVYWTERSVDTGSICYWSNFKIQNIRQRRYATIILSISVISLILGIYIKYQVMSFS